MQRTANARLKLRAENLEHRLMLAGDVTAAVVGGNLRIIGDALDNHLSIAEVSPGNFQVSGSDGTTINHQPLGTPFDAHEVTNNVLLRLGDGDDSVALRHLNIQGDLEVYAGEGDDDVDIIGTQVGKNVHIETGAGNDEVDLGLSDEAQPTLAASSPLPTGVHIKGNLDVRTGVGDDEVKVTDTHIGGGAFVNTGAGDDVVLMGIVSNSDGKLAAPADASEDPQGDWNVQVAHHLVILTGTGNDTIHLDSVRAKSAFFATGEGDDKLIVKDSSADHVFASLGAGDDVLDASGGGNFVGHFILFGGPGEDTLMDGPNNHVAHSHIFGVEHSV